MKIIKMYNQNRRDFRADYECENCGHIDYRKSGYDDRNFHDNVVPDMKCKQCGKTRNDLNIKGEHIETRYAEGQQV